MHPANSSFSQLTQAFAHAHINSTPASELSSPGFQTSNKKRKKGSADGNTPVLLDTQRTISSPSKCSKWIQDINSLDIARTVGNGQDQKTELIEDSNETKSKRQRKRKRKNKSFQVIQEGEVTDIKTSPSKFVTPFTTLPRETVKKPGSHIR